MPRTIPERLTFCDEHLVTATFDDDCAMMPDGHYETVLRITMRENSNVLSIALTQGQAKRIVGRINKLIRDDR